MGSAGLAYALNDPDQPQEVVDASAADRNEDRASRDLDRGAVPSPTPTTAATAPKPTSAPRAVRTTTPAPVRTAASAAEPPLPVAAGCGSYSGHRLTACSLLPSYGWSSAQMPALDQLWEHESGWNPRSENPSSGAYGIPQALPGSKMASAGDDWATNARTQIRWGLGYIRDRYGSPSAAWSFWQAHNWY